jgi:hypothetical protein
MTTGPTPTLKSFQLKKLNKKNVRDGHTKLELRFTRPQTGQPVKLQRMKASTTLSDQALNVHWQKNNYVPHICL